MLGYRTSISKTIAVDLEISCYVACTVSLVTIYGELSTTLYQGYDLHDSHACRAASKMQITIYRQGCENYRSPVSPREQLGQNLDY